MAAVQADLAARGQILADPEADTVAGAASSAAALAGDDESRMAAVLADLAERGLRPTSWIPAQSNSAENLRAAGLHPPLATDPEPEPEPEPDPEPEADGEVSVAPLPQVFRLDIEGLRAVAILLVVVYHAGVEQLTGGFVGVDVFFAISGYLITSQLVREVERSGRLQVGRFYARRVLRLLPAASLVTAVTLLAGWWWLPGTRLAALVSDALAANGYVINYRLAWLGTDYRTLGGAPSPLQHFWSLAVEEQFYLVVPLLLLVTLVWLRNRVVLATALVLLAGASLAWSVHSSATSPVWAYFGAPTRAWELGAGALLALGAPVLADRPRALAVTLRWAGLAVIAVSAVTFDTMTVFPGWHAAVPVGGALMVIAGGCVDTGTGSMLEHSVLRYIGARSYSFYLWHWPVLLITPYAVGRELRLWERLALMVGAFALAAGTFVFLERPLRDATGLRVRPVRAGALGLVMTVGVVSLALTLPHLPPRVALGSGTAAGVNLTGAGTARTRALAKQLRAAERVTTLPANLTPSLKKALGDDPKIARDGCLVSFDATSTPRRCESYGDASSRTTVVLFGDSHAVQWAPAMDRIARKRHWRLAVFTKVVCSAADVKIYLDANRGYTKCVTWRARAIARIRQLHPALVVTTSLADHGDLVGVKTKVDDAWAAAWRRTVDRLRSGSTRVVYLQDTPAPKGSVPDCLAQHPRAIDTCAQTTKLADGSPRRARMDAAAAQAGATVVTTEPWFCTSRHCPVVVGNILVYRDDSHVSGAYVRLLAPLLSERLKLPKASG
jgi:peptidoglycan/LPS O-acetylase OafA/YrhL